MSTFSIPLTTGNQKFNVSLADKSFEISLIYRASNNGGWFADIYEQKSGVTVNGIPLLIGTNLLEHKQYLGWGRVECALISGEERDLSFEDMGSTVIVYWEI